MFRRIAAGIAVLIAPPLMWDAGPVPDSALKPGEKSATEGYATITETLKSQLEKIGYGPAELWIQHDYVANSKLEKAPEFYE